MEADRNTLYFHTMENYNIRRYHISAVQGPLGIWYDPKAYIEDIFLKHFSSITNTSKPTLHQDIMELFSPLYL